VGDERLDRGTSRETLRQFLHEKLRAGALDEAVEEVVALFDALEEHRWRQLLALKQAFKAQYGRKSEKLSEAQLDLAFEAWVRDVTREGEDAGQSLERPAAELDEGQPRERSAPRTRRRRAPTWPADLPREDVVVPVANDAATCSTCRGERAVIGYEESEELDFVPASFRLRRLRREKRACPRCRDAVVVAEVPAKVIEKGLPGAGLLAQVLVAKYRDHVPLYRQRQIYKRSRVDLATSTLGDWVAAGAELLAPLARRLRERALAAAILQTDDTGLRVLDRDRPSGTKRGALWLYVGDGVWAWWHYTPDRSGEGPQAVLAERRGYLQADGYAGYQPLYERAREPCIEVGCWAHARRYFVRALESGDERAAPPLAQIARLYRVEAQAAETACAGPDARKHLREEHARPVLAELEAWLTAWSERVAPRMPLGEALTYARKRWRALTRYLEDGRLEIDNNRVERLIRPVALGRKNYLFAGSDAGAERAAVVYSVLATCTLHEIDPWAYLQDVLAKIAAGWPQRELDALLPDRWITQHPDALRCPPPA
jgi:transposase